MYEQLSKQMNCGVLKMREGDQVDDWVNRIVW